MNEYPIYRSDGTLYATYTDNGGEFIDVKFSMNGVDTRDIDTYSMKIDKPSFKNSVQFLDKSGFKIHIPETEDYFQSEQYLAPKDKYNLSLLQNVDGTLEVNKIFDDIGNINGTYRDLVDEGWEVGYDRALKMPIYLYNNLGNGEVEYVDVNQANPESIVIRIIPESDFENEIANKPVSIDTGDVINSTNGRYMPLTTMYKMAVPEATDTQLLDFFEEHVDFNTDIDYKSTIKSNNPNAKSSNDIAIEKTKDPTNPDVIAQESEALNAEAEQQAALKLKEEQDRQIAQIDAEANEQKKKLVEDQNNLKVNDTLGDENLEDEYAKSIITPDEASKSIRDSQVRLALRDIDLMAEMKKAEITNPSAEARKEDMAEIRSKLSNSGYNINGEPVEPGIITNVDGQTLGRVIYYTRTGKYDIVSDTPSGELQKVSYDNIDDFLEENPDVNILNSNNTIIKSGKNVLDNTASPTNSINGQPVLVTGAKNSESPLYNNKENSAPDNTQANSVSTPITIPDNARVNNTSNVNNPTTIPNNNIQAANANNVNIQDYRDLLSPFNPNPNSSNITVPFLANNEEELRKINESKIMADLASGNISKAEAEKALTEQVVNLDDIVEIATQNPDKPGETIFVPKDDYNGYSGSLNVKNIDPYMGKYNYKDLNIYGNRVQHAANAIPVAFNSAKALFDKAEVQSAINNPHDYAYLQGLKNNMEQLNTNDNRGAFAGMMQYLSGNAKGAGARLSNAQAAYSNYANQLDKEAARVQAANVGHMNNYLQGLKNVTDARRNERERVDSENRLHRATQEEFVRDTVKGYESMLRQKGVGMNKEWQAYIDKAAANASNPNYSFFFDPVTGELKATFEGGRKKGETYDANKDNGISSGKDINKRESSYNFTTGLLSNNYLQNALNLRINNEPLKPFAGLFGKNPLPGQVNIDMLNRERNSQYDWDKKFKEYQNNLSKENEKEETTEEETTEEKVKKLGGYVIREKGESKFKIPNSKKINPFLQFNKTNKYL